jgi:hypothetical protein
MAAMVSLAALMAVAWDSQLSLIDDRSLTLAHVRRDAIGSFKAAATLTRCLRRP